MQIGDIISKRRKELKYSQKELSDILNVSLSTISKWESNERIPDLITISAIAKILKLEIEEFLEISKNGEYVDKYEFDINQFAKNFSFLRKYNNYSLQILSNKLNIRYQTISKWERAESLPNLYVLNECAKIFGVSLSEIYFGFNFTQVEKEHTEEKSFKFLNKKILVGLFLICLIMCFLIGYFVIDNFYKKTGDSDEVSEVPTINVNDNSYADFEYQLLEHGIEIINYSGTDTIVNIPSIIDNLEVIKIDKDTFKNCKEKITKIHIPSTIVYNDSFLSGLNNLECIVLDFSLQIPLVDLFDNIIPASFNTIELDGVICSIPNAILKFPKDMTLVLLDNTWEKYELQTVDFIKKIIIKFSEDKFDNTITENLVLSNITNLEEVVIDSNWENIPSYFFKNCSKLKKVELPNTIKAIGGSAFFNCVSLLELNLPESEIEIGGSAFANCKCLKEMKVNATLNSLYVFRGCESLEKVTIISSYELLEEGMFYGCINLKVVYLYANYTHIFDYAFEGCVNLEHIYYDGTLEEWNNICFVSLSSDPVNVSPNVIIHTNN